MGNDTRQAISSACRQLLRPVVSVLIKCGMTWKEFSILSKSVFVQAATEEFGIRGRPTNISRVSILTGISRKEVKRQRDLLENSTAAASTRTNDSTRVLSAWHQDEQFLDAKGRPLALPMTGPAPSFEALFRRYGGDTPEQTLLKELRNGQSIELDNDGKVVARSRYYMPVTMATENIQLFGEHLCDHAETIHRNVTAASAGARRFERRATDERVDPAAADEFNKFLERRGQQFIEEIDDWLGQHRIEKLSNTDNPVRLGVGIYAVDGHLTGGTTR